MSGGRATWPQAGPFPDQILVAGNAQDVVNTVRLAKHHGYRIGIRSGAMSSAVPK